MRTEQQGQCALISRILIRSCKWGIPALALAWFLGSATPVVARSHKEDRAPAATASEARLPGDDIAKGMLERGKPSEKDHTAVLMPLTGTWNYVESFWTSPKAEPEHATGVVTNDMILDGHYLSSKVAGTRNIGRQQIPFEGQELIGFDNSKKSLSFVAVDSLTTGMTVGTGKFEEKTLAPAKAQGKKMTEVLPGDSKAAVKERIIWETGRFTNPLTGVEQGFHSELQFVDDEHYKRTISAVDNAGHETKLLEIDYTRK
jgi:hypothetical protein